MHGQSGRALSGQSAIQEVLDVQLDVWTSLVHGHAFEYYSRRFWRRSFLFGPLGSRSRETVQLRGSGSVDARRRDSYRDRLR